MKRIKLSMVFIVLLSCFSMNAQLLKSLKKKVKGKKAKTEVVESKALKLDWNTFNMTPAVTFGSLLYGTNVFTGGNTRFSSYTATFIPHKTENGADVNTISDQDKFLKIKVYKDGEYITYFEYDGGQTFDDGKKTKFNEPSSRYQRNGEWVGDTDVDAAKLGVGNYKLDFYAGDKMFYTFDFEVYKLTNGDPYASMNEMYLTRGPWNDYAFINYADTGNLIFGFYLNHEEFQPNKANSNKTNKSVKWGVKLFKDNKFYAEQYGNGLNVAQVRQAEWQEYTCAFKRENKPNETVKFESLTDGNYRLELSIENEKKPRIYNFTVAGNKIVPIPEQDRSKNTDPTRLIEGWNNYFWLKLEK